MEICQKGDRGFFSCGFKLCTSDSPESRKTAKRAFMNAV